MTRSFSYSPFICPICRASLQPDFLAKRWYCTGDSASNAAQKSHHFDMAKQGYVNLLPVQYKKSKQPGDSAAAITARQQFLQAGYYQNFADNLIKNCEHQLINNPVWLATKHKIWLDVGCGEGYYTTQFLRLQPSHLVALDISQPAVMATAKRLKPHLKPHFKPLLQNDRLSDCDTYCMVASAAQLPLASASVTVLSSIFSPILPTEFARVVQAGGLVVIAKPAETHLFELREALFDRVDLHDSDKFIEQMAQDFRLIAQEKIAYNIEVEELALVQLMTMTPYAYRATAEKRVALLEKVKMAGKMTLSLSFYGYFFQKN